jgi:hypothetical protein
LDVKLGAKLGEPEAEDETLYGDLLLLKEQFGDVKAPFAFRTDEAKAPSLNTAVSPLP